MITDKDITKLKKVFVTKDYFKKELKRELSNYPTKTDLKNELSNYATKEEMEKALDERTNIMVKEIRTVIEIVGDMNLQIEKISKKLDKRTTEHDDILEHHQRQIDNLNDKVFPSI